GICRQRKRCGDHILVLNFATAASVAVDPIEKKPLYHFKPGSNILSVGANGCNLRCSFCQNSEISQGSAPTSELSVDQLVENAGTGGSLGVAFTYSEPLMWYEYVLDASRALKQAGYVTVLVTNGFIEEAPLRKLLPFIDAMNIDYKSSNEQFYKKICKGRLGPVQRTIALARDFGVHIELTHLLVTGWNDNDMQIEKLVAWIANLDKNIPLHLSRYFPHYQYSEAATSTTFMRHALRICRKELNYVYLGNIAEEDGADSYCPNCNSLLVSRSGYAIRVENLSASKCAVCNSPLPFR
ncbi:AmmeMemoRadiSam system radical SAM enzyme, partial [bacterium]|nr:AmmeMemoRadiSam system radical SAM enzyme [bacterium]